MKKKIRGGQTELFRDQQKERVDQFPPLYPTSIVWTKKPNLGLRGKLSNKLWNKRQWGVRGMVTDVCNPNEAWHEVLLPNGSLAYYHQTELGFSSGDDGGDEYTPQAPSPSMLCLAH